MREAHSNKSRKGPLSVFNPLISGVNSMICFVRNRDIYGHPVTLNYRGDDTYKTCIGGTLSMVLLFLVSAYTFLKGKYMIDIEEWQLTQQQILASRADLVEPKHFNGSQYANISIGIQFQIRRERMKFKWNAEKVKHAALNR